MESIAGQNLVQNYSFENYLTCNNFFYDSNYTKWYSTKDTPNYLSTCFSNNIAGVPINMSGLNYQQPKTGNAYVGILTYNESVINDREYFANILIAPLANNAYYNVKFYVVNSQCSKYTTSLQLSFTSNLSYTSTAGFIALTPHIYEFKNNKIADTLNWIEINGVYKANGTEQYVTIGNFNNDLISEVDTTNYNLGCPGAYYFIDDVSVEPICTPFWTYRDTTLAIGQDSVLIGPAITGLNINWYDASNTFITNAPGIYVKPTQTTTYTAVEDFCGTTYTNTIVVTVQPTGVNEFGMTNADLRILPNPANDLLIVTSRYDFEKVELLSITGQILLSELTKDKSQQINLADFSAGIYFVRVSYEDGRRLTKKIIKQ